MVVLGIILGLLLAIIVLNFSCIDGGSKFVDSLYNRFGDTGAFRFMFPAYEAQPADAALTETNEITPLEATSEPAAEPADEPTAASVPEISIPSFDGTGSGDTADTANTADTAAIEPVG